MIFEEGLVYDTKDLNLDGMREYAKDWNIEWKLLESGTFSGRIAAIHTQNVQLGFTTYSLPVEIEGKYPEGSILIFLLQSGVESVVYNNLKIEIEDIVIIEDTKKVDFLSSNAFGILSICVEKKFFFDHFHAHFSLDSSEILHQQKFKLKNGSESTFLSSKLVDTIQSLQNKKLMDKVDFRKLEENILHDIFSSMVLEKLPQKYKQFDITEIRDYLKENFENEINLDQMANDFKISKRQLHSTFKNFYGLTPKKYLHILRLHEIRKYLKEFSSDKASVSDVAFRFGFHHLSYFTKEYKKLFHELPSKTLKS